MRNAARWWVGLGLAGALTACETPHPEQDPAYIKATSVESRVDVIERQNAAFLDVQQSLSQAQADQRVLKGQIEELQHPSVPASGGRGTCTATSPIGSRRWMRRCGNCSPPRRLPRNRLLRRPRR